LEIFNNIYNKNNMSFSWNKWRQYIIEEASGNKETDREIINAAVNILGKTGQETHYLHRKFREEGSDDIDGVDLSNARAIIRKGGKIMEEKSLINPEAEEISPEDLDAAADYFDSLEEDKFDKPGWDLRAIMDSFKEDFEEATRDTDDIPYAQSRVVDAYKDVFAKSHPQLAGEIEAYLNDRDRSERRSMFQNVSDDPEVVGRDMMREFRDDGGEEDFGGDPQDFGNDLESRFQFIAPRLYRFPGKKEQLKPLFIQMTDAMEEDDKVAFDDAFVPAMQIMGYEDMLKENDKEPTNEIFGFGSPVDWREMNFGSDPNYAPGLETFKKSPTYKALNKAVKTAKKSGKSEGFDVPKDLVGAVTTTFYPMKEAPEDGPLHSITLYVSQKEANDAKDMGKDFKEFFRVLGVLTTGSPFKQFEPSFSVQGRNGKSMGDFGADFDFKIPRNLRGQYKDAIAKYFEKEGIKMREMIELEENDKVLDEVINTTVLDKIIDMHADEMSDELLSSLEDLRQDFMDKEVRNK